VRETRPAFAAAVLLLGCFTGCGGRAEKPPAPRAGERVSYSLLGHFGDAEVVSSRWADAETTLATVGGVCKNKLPLLLGDGEVEKSFTVMGGG